MENDMLTVTLTCELARSRTRLRARFPYPFLERQDGFPVDKTPMAKGTLS